MDIHKTLKQRCQKPITWHGFSTKITPSSLINIPEQSQRLRNRPNNLFWQSVDVAQRFWVKSTACSSECTPPTCAWLTAGGCWFMAGPTMCICANTAVWKINHSSAEQIKYTAPFPAIATLNQSAIARRLHPKCHRLSYPFCWARTRGFVEESSS